MTLKAVFLAFLSCLASGTAEQNCSNVQCKLLPVGKNVASEFQLKAAEKGVRMIYLNLEIGNDSYHPLELKDEFLPERWVWAQSISEPMLSLSYDYDILSLGLLNYQVRRMSVAFEDYPSGCLAGLNSSCQDKVVGTALLKNVTKDSSGEISQETDTVCVAAMKESFSDFFDGNVNFFCCTNDENDPRVIRCEQPVKSSAWLKAFKYILDILTIVMILYCAAFPLALPDFIFDFKKELEKEERQEQQEQQQQQLNERDSGEGGRADPPDRSEYDSLDQSSVLYLDDASPITCSTLLSKCISDKYTRRLPNLRLSFNIKLAFLWYFEIPLFFYIKLGLNLAIKKNFLDETSKKEGALLVGPLFSFLFDLEKPASLVFSVLVLVGVPFVVILFLGPKDFLLVGGENDKYRCYLCKEITPLVGKDMLNHIKKWKVHLYEVFSCLLKSHSTCITKSIECCTGSCEKQVKPPCKRLRRGSVAFGVFICNIVIFVCLGVILGAFFVVTFLVVTVVLSVVYSPFFTLHYFLLRKMHHLNSIMIKRTSKLLVECVESHQCPFGNCTCLCLFVALSALVYSALFMLLYLLLLFLSSFACLIASLSCRFIVRMFGFLIMGLVLNAEIASPFVTFFIVATTNLFLCYYNLQKRYKEVKKMISKHWQRYNRGESDSIDGCQDVIPEDLFWHVCGEESKSLHKVLPIRREIFRMLRNMAIILIFLVLALCSVIFFGNTYNISAVASTIAVFVSGVIPGLFFKGLTKQNKFTGEKKHEMVNETKKAVEEYRKKVRINGRGRLSPNRQEIKLDEFVVV